MLTQVGTLSAHLPAKAKSERLNCLVLAKRSESGQKWNVAEELMDKLENFTCLLYASKSGIKELNSLRYHLF